MQLNYITRSDSEAGFENLVNDKCDSDKGNSDKGDSSLINAGINPYLTAWDRVQISRKIDRPSGSDYIEALLRILWNFMETEITEMIRQSSVESQNFMENRSTVIVQEKGTNTKENIAHNFACRCRKDIARRCT